METQKLDALLGLVAEIQREVRELRALVAQRLHAAPEMKPETMTVAEFAAEIGRSKDWVGDQIRLRRIRPARIGIPYRIPRSELLRLLKGGD